MTRLLLGSKGMGSLIFTSLGLGTPLEEGQDLAGSTVPSSSEGELVFISKTGNLISFTEYHSNHRQEVSVYDWPAIFLLKLFCSILFSFHWGQSNFPSPKIILVCFLLLLFLFLRVSRLRNSKVK